MPHSRQVLLKIAVQGMLDQAIIEPSCSPHNAPLLLIPKKQGGYHVVMDLRKSNLFTIPDRYQMQRSGDIQSLGGPNRIFSTLALQSGFLQVMLEESSRPYTAFTTNSGQFMFTSYIFHTLMNSVL